MTPKKISEDAMELLKQIFITHTCELVEDSWLLGHDELKAELKLLNEIGELLGSSVESLIKMTIDGDKQDYYLELLEE